MQARGDEDRSLSSVICLLEAPPVLTLFKHPTGTISTTLELSNEQQMLTGVQSGQGRRRRHHEPQGQSRLDGLPPLYC